MARLDRLGRLTREELRWRAGVALRTGGHFLRARARAPRWERGDLIGVLTDGVADTALRDAARRGEWHAVHDSLVAVVRARRARFVLDPSLTGALRDAVLARWPGADRDAAGRADRILAGDYDLLGYRGLSFSPDRRGTDWHFDPVHRRRAPRLFHARVPYLDPAIGDHKIIWELNRHQHWLRLGRAALLTGDGRYARQILADLDSWLAANPPLVGINWASMLEIGFRAMSWTWAAHCLLGMEERQLCKAADEAPPPWLVDVLVGLHRQMTHVEQNLSYYFSPNTHLTGEALALYVVGTAFPELAASGRWAATGRRILLAEIDRQILADGGHVERSTHYQRYTLDFYLLALLTARRGGDEAAVSSFADAAARLAAFTQTIADSGGRLPLIGDDDGGMLWPLTGRDCNDVRDSLAVAAFVLGRSALAPWGAAEEAAWIAGPEAIEGGGGPLATPAEGVRSRALADSGYFVARSEDGAHAVLDAGAHGYMNGGHAHADALAVTLSVDGRPLLVDPGTSTYTMDPALRDRLRSSTSHNTVTVDGRSPSMPAGPFHWQSRTDAHLEEWRHNPKFDWVEASHDGYAPLQHRRSLLRTDGGGWLIADEILGSGCHAAAAHWHFDPAWNVAAERAALRATRPDGGAAWLLHDSSRTDLFHGDERTGLGWHAPVYGMLLPTWSARVCLEGDAPLDLLTWIGGQGWMRPVLAREAAECDPSYPTVAARVTDGDRTAVFLLRPGGPVPHAARTCRVADYETDARVLHYTTAGDRLLALALVDARCARSARHGWCSIDSEEPVPDLSLSLAAGALDVWTSAPPARLRVRSATPFHIARLNGRELRSRRLWRGEGLEVDRADWPVHVPIPSPPRPWLESGAGFAEH